MFSDSCDSNIVLLVFCGEYASAPQRRKPRKKMPWRPLCGAVMGDPGMTAVLPATPARAGRSRGGGEGIQERAWNGWLVYGGEENFLCPLKFRDCLRIKLA